MKRPAVVLSRGLTADAPQTSVTTNGDVVPMPPHHCYSKAPFSDRFSASSDNPRLLDGKDDDSEEQDPATRSFHNNPGYLYYLNAAVLANGAVR